MNQIYLYTKKGKESTHYILSSINFGKGIFTLNLYVGLSLFIPEYINILCKTKLWSKLELISYF